jgi:O-antigen/teichoic acid export membrane protein
MFRCFLTLLFAGIVIYQSMPLAYFCSIFSWVESCLFLSLSCCSLRHLSLSKKWLAFHFSYSKRAYISGFLQTAYTRVDILMLGFFVSESSIGIYSIAAMVVEGFHQFVAAFRYNLNPILARLIADKKQSRSLSNFCRSVVLKSYVVALMLGAIALVAYKPGLSLLGLQPFFLESFPFFVVLLCGLLLVAGFIPLGQIFLQTNDPQVHSALLFLSIIVNVALNLTLIPMMGVMGAAIATALTFVLHAALLVLRMRKYFLIDFFTWLQRNNA